MPRDIVEELLPRPPQEQITLRQEVICIMAADIYNESGNHEGECIDVDSVGEMFVDMCSRAQLLNIRTPTWDEFRTTLIVLGFDPTCLPITAEDVEPFCLKYRG